MSNRDFSYYHEQDGYSLPVDSSVYSEPPYEYKNSKQIHVYFKADPDDINELLPSDTSPRIQAAPEGLCGAILFDHGNVFRMTGGYNEFIFNVLAEFDGQKGFFSTHVFMNAESPIYVGREMYGAPKRMADIEFVTGDGQELSTARVERDGIDICTATMKPVDEAEPTEMPAHPYWLYQYIRGIDGEILVKRLNTLTTPIRELHELWKGPGTVSFEPSVAAPFHIIEPEEYVDSFYMVADIAMPTGEVVHDFLE